VKPFISICVPSWDSLEYLKILHKGLIRNTKLNYELIIHDNGSTDGTLQWLKDNKIQYTHSNKNLGFCGVNAAIQQAHGEYIMIFNSDMYPLPLWDVEIFKQIQKFKKQKKDKFTISCALIEPVGNNPEYVISNFGHDAKSFNEEDLVRDYISNRFTKYKQYNTTQYSHPILMPRAMWEEMGYMDESYFPGWSVDHDLAVCAYEVGCRDFIMLTMSRAYHFISKTFTKLPRDIKNRHGQDVFEKKWGFTVDSFRAKINIAQSYKEVVDGIL